MLCDHRLTVGPGGIFTQLDGVYRTVLRDLVRYRTSRLNRAVGLVLVQRVHNLVLDQVRGRICRGVHIQRGRLGTNPITQRGLTFGHSPVLDRRRTEWREDRLDIRTHQDGAVVVEERNDGRVIGHHNLLRLLPQLGACFRVELRQCLIHQIPVFLVIPERVLERGIGMEDHVEDILSIAVVHDPAHPVGIKGAPSPQTFLFDGDLNLNRHLNLLRWGRYHHFHLFGRNGNLDSFDHLSWLATSGEQHTRHHQHASHNIPFSIEHNSPPQVNCCLST